MKKAKKKLAYLPICEECAEKPAFLSEKELQLHQMKFHQCSSIESSENTCSSDETGPGIVQGIRKTAKRISELMGSKQKLKQELKETKAEVKRLDALSGTQEHTVRLLNEEIQNLERKYVAKNFEISKLKNETNLLCKEDFIKQTPKTKDDFHHCCKAEGFRKSIDADNLCLLDSMQKFTNTKHKFKSVSTESSSEEEIRHSNIYKKSQLANMEKQIKTLQSEVEGLKNHKKSQQKILEYQETSHNEIIRAQQEAMSRLLEKTNEVEECKKEIQSLKNEVENQKALIQRITKESLKYQDKYKTMKLQTMESAHEIVRLTSEVKRLCEIKDSVEEEMQHLRSSVVMAQTKIADKEASIRKLTQREKALKTKIKDIQIDLEQINMVKSKDNTELNNLNHAKQCKIAELTFENDLLNKDIEKYKKQVQTCSGREHEFEEQIRKLELDKTMITRERNNLKSQIERIREEERTAKSSLQQLQEINGCLTEENKVITNQKMNLKREVWSLKENFSKMKNKFTKKKDQTKAAKIVELEHRRDDIKEIKDDLQHATLQHQQESEHLLKENAQLREEIKEHDTKMENMKKESKNIQDGLLQLIDKLKDNSANVSTSYFVDSKGSVGTDDGLEAELQSQIQSLQKNFQDSKRNAEEQEMKFKKLKALHCKLDEELIKVSNEKFEIEEQYEVLKKHADSLIEENNNLHKQMELSSVTFKELSVDLEKKKESEKRLLSQLKEKERDTNEKIRQLEEAIQALKEKHHTQNKVNENDNLKQTLEDSKLRIDEIEQKLSSSDSPSKEQHDTSKMDAEIGKLKTEASELRANIKQCKDDKKKSDLKIKKDATEINKLKAQVQNINKEKELLGKRLNENLSTQAALSEQVEQLTLRVVSVDNLRKEVKDAEIEKKNMRDQLEQSSKKESNLKARIQELELKSSQIKANTEIDIIEKLRNELDESQKETHRLKIELNESKATQRSLQTKLDEIEVNSSSNESEKWKDELEERSQREKRQLKIELEESQVAQKTLQMKLDELGGGESSYGDVEKWKAELEECESEKHQLKVELEESRAAQRALQMKLDELDDNDSSSDDVERWKSELEDSNREKHQLKIQLEESLAKQRLLQSKLGESSDESDGDSESDKLEELKEQLSEMKKENESIQAELDNTRQKLDNKSKSEESSNEATQKLKRQNESLHKQVETHKKSLEINKRNRESDFTEIQTLKFQLEEARQKILNANNDLTSKSKELSELKRQKNQKDSATISDLQKQLEKNKDNAPELEKMSKENASLKRDLVDLKAKLTKTTGQLDNKTEKICDLTDRLNKVAHSEHEIASEHKALKQQLVDKEHEIKSHKLEIKELSAKVNANESEKEKDDKIVNLKVNIQDLREEVKDLQKELEDTKQQLKDKSYELGILKSQNGNGSGNSKSSSNDDLEQMKKDLSKKSDLLETANGEIDRKNARIKDLKDKCDTLTQNIKILHEERNDEVEELEQMILNCQRQYEALEMKYVEDMQANPNPTAYEVAQLKTICQELEEENMLLKQAMDQIQREKDKTANMQSKISSQKSKGPSNLDETINWNTAYRSYTNSPEAQMEINEPNLEDSDESLNLRVPSQRSHFMMHGKEEDDDEIDLNLAHPDIAANFANITIDDVINSDKDYHYPDNDMDPYATPFHNTFNYPRNEVNIEQPVDVPKPSADGKPKKDGKKKKEKKKKDTKTPKTELAPLSGPLPPVHNNANFTSPSIPPIRGSPTVAGGNSRIPAAKPIEPGLTSQKKVAFSLDNNPLDAKPLPGLKAQRSEQEAFANKYSPSIKKLDPPKPLSGPDPSLMQKFHQHAPSSPHFDYYLRGAEEDYMDGQEDVDALVKDLDHTNAKLDKIRQIQGQFY